MNKNQKIVLIVGLLLIAIILIYWQTQGGYTSSKTQVQVERVDELFNTTYMEWEDRFVLGLDYAGTASAVIAVLSGILIFLLRNKKQEMSNRINGLTIGLFILYLLYFCLELLNSIKNENDFEFTKLLLSRDFLIFTVIWIVLIVVIQNIRNIDFATKNSDPEYSSKSASKFSFKIISVITFSFILITLLIFKGDNEKLSNCATLVGSYKGSSKMGYSLGTATLRIYDDCNAKLTYDQGTYGAESESGYIISENGNYKFRSTSGGGEYTLKISGSKITLNGYNWEVVLYKLSL